MWLVRKRQRFSTKGHTRARTGKEKDFIAFILRTARKGRAKDVVPGDENAADVYNLCAATVRSWELSLSKCRGGWRPAEWIMLPK
ncbi:nitrous oxide reductase [Anopheles sinensis]|uniref:Nitrous oxide reductase n=1 Tax=Anopheles sinensis TaxID=74873 RepID=A0A084WUA0_ANOSI|nr:nitrous oxide reductase [Anopheles sinensis]